MWLLIYFSYTPFYPPLHSPRQYLLIHGTVGLCSEQKILFYIASILEYLFFFVLVGYVSGFHSSMLCSLAFEATVCISRQSLWEWMGEITWVWGGLEWQILLKVSFPVGDINLVCETGPQESPIAWEIPDKSKGPGDQLLLTWIRQEFHKALQIHGAKQERKKKERNMIGNFFKKWRESKKIFNITRSAVYDLCTA